MSKHFTLPFNPLNWQASPRDLSGDSVDYPYLGIYAAESTQRYILGTRYITWDGRVFRYASAGDTLSSAHGCWSGDWQAVVQWAQFPTTHEIGANPIHITTRTTYHGIAFDGVFAEDDLAGGFIALFTGAAGVEALNYGIIGNDALAAAGTLAIYLDHPLRSKITLATGSAEAIFSPYRHMHRIAAGEPNSCVRHPVMGVPMSAPVDGDYCWLQTWGPIHISTPDASVGSAVNNFKLVWRHDGSVEDASTTALGMQQHAGFTLFQDYDDGTPAQATPFMMLQISP